MKSVISSERKQNLQGGKLQGEFGEALEEEEEEEEGGSCRCGGSVSFNDPSGETGPLLEKQILQN